MATVSFPFLLRIHVGSGGCIWKLHLEDISSLTVNQQLTPDLTASINYLSSTHSHTLMTGLNKFHW